MTAFAQEVELMGDDVRELIDQRERVVFPAGGQVALDLVGEEIEELDVGVDQRLDAGALHLDDDRGPVGQAGAMHLGDGRGGERRVLELREQLRQRAAELRFDDPARFVGGERRHPVLQRLQLADHVRGKQILAHAQRLSELDERRAELFECGTQTARRGGVRGRLGTVGRGRPDLETQTFYVMTEAVLREHPDDARQPPDVAHREARGHGARLG